RRVPLHGLAHVRHVAHDQSVEALAKIALPAGYRGDVCLHGSVAVGLGELRIAAGEQNGIAAFFSRRHWRTVLSTARSFPLIPVGLAGTAGDQLPQAVGDVEAPCIRTDIEALVIGNE